MMLEKFLKRLGALEEARKLQEAGQPMVSLGFMNPDKTLVEFRVAFSGGFKCYRNDGESEKDFETRAHTEVRAIDKGLPPPILIFSDREIPFDASV
jgi:hypothetical protein